MQEQRKSRIAGRRMCRLAMEFALSVCDAEQREAGFYSRSLMIRSAPVKLSARASAIGESATLKVTRRAAELRAQGVSVVDLGAGEPDFRSPAVAVEAARKALADGFTRFTPGSGLPALRTAVAESYQRRHGTPWQAADSVITVGGKAALFELALAVFDEGQEVVLPSPCWVTFPEQIRFAGARPVF